MSASAQESLKIFFSFKWKFLNSPKGGLFNPDEAKDKDVDKD